MAVPELLLGTLEGLSEDDFKTFKSHLTSVVLEGCEQIPPSSLESSSRADIVMKMIDSYSEDKSVIVAIEILKVMSRDDAAEKLKDEYAEGTTDTSVVETDCASARRAARRGNVTISTTVTRGTHGSMKITIRYRCR